MSSRLSLTSLLAELFIADNDVGRGRESLVHDPANSVRTIILPAAPYSDDCSIRHLQRIVPHDGDPKDRRILPNLQSLVWDARINVNRQTLEAMDVQESMWRLSDIVWNIHSTHRHECELYINDGKQDWSGVEDVEVPSAMTWEGSLAGMPSVLRRHTRGTRHTLILDTTDYCKNETPHELLRQLEIVCRNQRVDNELNRYKSDVHIYLTVDSDEYVASQRLLDWKRELEEVVASTVDCGHSDLHLHVGERRPETRCNYTVFDSDA